MRTEEEIASLTRHKGEALWIKYLQDDGEHDVVDAFFEHHNDYEIVVISNCMCVLKDLYGDKANAHLTIELLDRMTTICTDLDKESGPWNPDEFRALSGYFVYHFDEWPAAKNIINLRKIKKAEEVMNLLQQTVSTETSLLSGVL